MGSALAFANDALLRYRHCGDVELQMCVEVVVAPYFSTVVLNNMDSMNRGPNCGGGHRGPIVG